MNKKDYNKKEAFFILNNYLNLPILEDEIIKVKVLFNKLYSNRVVKRIDFLCNKKLYFLLAFFTSDEIDKLENDGYRYRDVLEMFRIETNIQIYYVLFSTRFDHFNDEFGGTKKEKVEVFTKKKK